MLSLKLADSQIARIRFANSSSSNPRNRSLSSLLFSSDFWSLDLIVLLHGILSTAMERKPTNWSNGISDLTLSLGPRIMILSLRPGQRLTCLCRQSSDELMHSKRKFKFRQIQIKPQFFQNFCWRREAEKWKAELVQLILDNFWTKQKRITEFRTLSIWTDGRLDF